jgi:hypothetical protein
MLNVAFRIRNDGFFTRGNCARQGQLLEEAEQFEHDYDNDNYADYVEDVSVHAELISEWVGGGQHLMQTEQHRWRRIALVTRPSNAILLSTQRFTAAGMML